MDSVDQVKKLREDYERALDAAESRRVAYHRAVLDLYRGGTPLREIAQELGLSHQRVHQIVSGEAPRERSLKKAAAGGAAVLVLLAAVFGGLRLAHAHPFASSAGDLPASPNTVQRIDQIVLRVAGENGDPHPDAMSISRSSEGGPIHVRVHGDFTGALTGAHSTTLMLTLDPSTLRVTRATPR